MWEGQATHSPMNLKKKVKENLRKDGGNEGVIGVDVSPMMNQEREKKSERKIRWKKGGEIVNAEMEDRTKNVKEDKGIRKERGCQQVAKGTKRLKEVGRS